MANGVLLSPLPIGRVPEHGLVVAARLDELEILAIRDFVFINRECWDVCVMGFVLVVPSETIFVTSPQAEGDRTGGNVNHCGSDRGNYGLRTARRSYLLIGR